jgi:hypothetical protein
VYTAEDTFDARALLEGISKPPLSCRTDPLFLPAAPAVPARPCAHPALAGFYDQKISQRLALLRATPKICQEISAFTVTKIRDVYIHAPTWLYRRYLHPRNRAGDEGA